MNAAGYRYGAADQAFYLPSVLDAINRQLYPRDDAVLSAQGALMVSDDIIATITRASGVSVPVLFLGGYLLSVLTLFGAGAAFARALGQSWWGAALLTAILTLRHRIPKTGVNTLEGHFHPRILAFSVGIAAAALFLRGRTAPALAVVAVAGIIHPTIGVWFGCWIVIAAIVADPQARSWLTGTAAIAASGAAVMTLGPMRHRLTPMDEAWLSVIAGKDYLFPADWRLDVWLLNLAAPAIVLMVYRRRRRRSAATPPELGLVIGAVALLALFLIAVPLTVAHIALAVQLQVSRIFWLIEFAAIAYLVAELDALQRRAAKILLGVVVLASCARGWYVMRVEHPGRPVWQVQLPNDAWHDAMRWIAARRGYDAVLTDPGHAFRYGTSVRVAAQRDVYLEEVKDAALAIYSRDVALRVRERTDALGHYDALTPSHALMLARRYDLRYLVSAVPVDMPEVYRNDRFHVYDLKR